MIRNTRGRYPFRCKRLPLALLAAWALLATPTHALRAGSDARAKSDNVTVTKREPTSEKKFYDPSKPPAEKATSWDGQISKTRCEYPLYWYIRHDTTESEEPPVGGTPSFIAFITITSVDIKIEMSTTTWLPEGSSAELVAYEEGNRRIGEMAYERADVAARQVARSMIGKEYQARAETLSEAEAAARELAGADIRKAYNATFCKPAKRVREIYGEITQHGENRDLTEDAAIEKAIAQYREERKQTAAQ